MKKFTDFREYYNSLKEAEQAPETELTEAKFLFKDAEEQIKTDGFWDDFLSFKKKLKPTHTIVAEFNNGEEIISLELMPKKDYEEMAKDKNWADAMVRVYESAEETEEFEDIWTKEDLIDFINSLDDDELQEVGDFIYGEVTEDEEFDDDDYEDSEDLEESELTEVKYFDKKKNQLDREKRQNIAQRKKKAKLLKKYYKKNKARIKLKAKKYRKIAKRNPNRVRHHRGL